MYTSIDMLIVAVLAMLGTAFICFFIAGASMQEHEKNAYMEGFVAGQRDKMGEK